MRGVDKWTPNSVFLCLRSHPRINNWTRVGILRIQTASKDQCTDRGYLLNKRNPKLKRESKLKNISSNARNSSVKTSVPHRFHIFFSKQFFDMIDVYKAK